MFPGSTMINSLFWMILGAMQILIIASGYAWIKHLGKTIKNWQMAILYILFALICLTIGAGFTLAGEYESQAGWYFIGFLGLPQLIIFVFLINRFVFSKKV